MDKVILGSKRHSSSAVLSLLSLILITFPATASIRVASSTVCTDQIVVALVELERIAALSLQARDPRLSAVATRVNGLPLLSSAAEAFVLVNADVVIGLAWDKARTLAMVEQLGARVVRLSASEDFSAITRLLRSSALILDSQIQGERLATDLEQRLAMLGLKQYSRPLRAAYIRPDGGSAGKGTFVDAVLNAAGFENLATTLGRSGWNRFDLETLIMNPPEVIIAAFFDSSSHTSIGWSLSRHFSRHPAFRALWQRIPVIEVPSALITCGTWPLIEAAELLARSRTSLEVSIHEEEK